MTKIIRKVTRSLDGFLTRIYIYIFTTGCFDCRAWGFLNPFLFDLACNKHEILVCGRVDVTSQRICVYIYIFTYIYIYSRYIIGILIYFDIFYIDNTYTA